MPFVTTAALCVTSACDRLNIINSVITIPTAAIARTKASNSFCFDKSL